MAVNAALAEVVIRPQQATLLGGKHDEEQRATGLHRVGRERVSQCHYADRARAVIVGAVIDARGAGTVVVKVAAENNGLALSMGSLPSIRPATLYELARRCSEAAVWISMVAPGTSNELGAGFALMAVSTSAAFFPAASNRESETRRPRVQIGMFGPPSAQRLRQNARSLRCLHLAASTTTPVGRRRCSADRTLVIGVGHGGHRNGAVALGVEQLVIVVGVAGVANAVEHGVRVGLLWLMIEDEDDLAAGVDTGVIIVVQFGGGDAEAGKDHAAGDGDFVSERRRGVGGLKNLAGPSLASVSVVSARSAEYSISGTGCR